jgi:hypothetical protein
VFKDAVLCKCFSPSASPVEGSYKADDLGEFLFCVYDSGGIGRELLDRIASLMLKCERL